MKNIFCLLIGLSATLRLFAQDTAALGTSEYDCVPEVFGKNRAVLMKDFLQISMIEEKTFGDALLEYEKEKTPWLAERVALLRMYNQEFSSLDERKMNSLTRQLINNDQEFGRLQIRYFRKMNKVLGANRAAKFFQLDSYLEQSSRVYIQKGLPFIKELEAERQVFTRSKPVAQQ
ncbi:hypothetical protein [Chitinophaga sp. MM2321]|uniref:hypothetical protein n=1 Tax=Chitinophaga sp. MM2321 TaxID=3137178 RepID=UPI0032D5AEC8